MIEWGGNEDWRAEIAGWGRLAKAIKSTTKHGTKSPTHARTITNVTPTSRDLNQSALIEAHYSLLKAALRDAARLQLSGPVR
ncbi:hypothetical protein RPW65_07195 [Pseudomonas sp. NyZ704]|nr:hypothetical protein RPW65_07195 [Pseudomonas sp. NyZ704]